MSEYVEMEIDEEVYKQLKEKYDSYKKKYDSYKNISLSFDEYVNYLIQVGLDND